MCVYYMSNYKITPYSFNKAKELGLKITVSTNPLKKIDIYKNNIFIGSIGDSRYQDYPNYILTYNLEYANKRRNLYINRHKKNADVKYSKQWLALNLLW